jgi:hypothetical protein
MKLSGSVLVDDHNRHGGGLFEFAIKNLKNPLCEIALDFQGSP